GRPVPIRDRKAPPEHPPPPPTRKRSGPSARPSPSQSASTASLALSPPAENGLLGSLHAGSAPESLAVGSDRSILTAAAVPQPPKNITTLPRSPSRGWEPS